MELAVLLSFLLILSQISAENDFRECVKLHTSDYEYATHFPLSYLFEDNSANLSANFRFEFYVKCSSNALILLSETNDMEASKAYEIVIGGGQNSFSQIRIYPKGAKATQSTKDIVSPIEYRGFWIRLYVFRVIMVGRIGEFHPFLFWVNNNPFPIRYFAFSSWNNGLGEWYFGCNRNRKHGESDRANMTALRRLKDDLLTSYNPTIIPQGEGYRDEAISVHLEVSYFHLDEKKGELTLDGMAYVKWVDWKLSWKPPEYDGIELMHVTPFQIWTPRIRVINSLALEDQFLLTLGGDAAVKSEGEVSWIVPFHSVTLCLLGYKNWPFDIHNCSLVFESWTEPLKVDIKEMSFSKIDLAEWELEKINGKELVISRLDDFGIVVDLYFFRREPSYELILFPPFIGASVLALISFWLHPNSSVKLFLNCGSIILLILILLSMGERITVVITATPKIVILYSWSVLVTVTPLIVFVGLKHIPSSVRMPRILLTVFNSSLLEIVFLLPENPQSRMAYSHLREQEERSLSAVRLITIIERIMFLVYMLALIIPFFLFFYKV